MTGLYSRVPFVPTQSQGNRVVEHDTHYLLAPLYLRLKRADLAELHKNRSVRILRLRTKLV